MNRYPEGVLDFTDLLKRSVRLHYLTLRHTIFSILMIVLLKYIDMIVFLLFPSQRAIHFATAIVSFLLGCYFFAAALLTAQRAFMDKSVSIFSAMRAVWQRLFSIFGTLVAYVVGAIAIRYFVVLIVNGIARMFPELKDISHFSYIFMTALLLVYVAMFFFSFPIAVLDEKNPHSAFHDSAVLGERNKFGILILFFIMLTTLILMTPGVIHSHLLSVYHLDAAFDFVVLCVAMPIYINLMLLLINDSKRQIHHH